MREAGRINDEGNRIAREVGSRKKAFQLVKYDHKLVRFFLPLLPEDPDEPVWSIIRKLSDKIGEGVTTHMRAIARETDEALRDNPQATGSRRLKIFTSSVQKEFTTERKALAEYLVGNPLLRRFFECFLFEDQPAADRRADQCYLDEVDHCDIYERELIRFGPFDATFCRNTSTDDLDEDKISRFLVLARRGRNFPLPGDTPPYEVLVHLNLLDKGQPTNAAMLLFGKPPQRFLITSEVTCAHFHGYEMAKPIPSYQVYKGTVFDLVDKAKDFVLSKIDLWVGARASMKVGQLHLDAKNPNINIIGKGKKIRTLYLLPKAVAHLKSHIKECHGDNPNPDAYVFYSRNAGPCGKMTQMAVSKRLKLHAGTAHKSCVEVPLDLHAHQLRHAKASHWLEDGINIVQISLLLGHEQLQTTLVYLDVTIKQKAEALATLEDENVRKVPKKWKGNKASLANFCGVKPIKR